MTFWTELSNRAKALAIIIPVGTALAGGLIGAVTAVITIERHYTDWNKIRDAFNNGDILISGSKVYLRSGLNSDIVVQGDNDMNPDNEEVTMQPISKGKASHLFVLEAYR